MSLYSVVHKDRKVLQSNQSDSPCSIEHQTMNYEDTESEYASELRRQTYLQKIGDHGGYSRNSQHPSVSSSIYSSTLPHPHVQMNPGTGNGLEIYRTQQRPRHVRLSSDLDLDSAGGSGSSNSDRASHYTPLTTPIVIETTLQTGTGNSNVAMDPNIGPIC